MRSSFGLVLAAATALVTQAVAGPIVSRSTPVTPGGVAQIKITNKNTLNATNPDPSPPPGGNNSTHKLIAQSNNRLPIDLVNSVGGNLNAYITGLDPSGRMVFVGSNGQFIYPYADSSYTSPHEVTDNIAIPLNSGQGSTTRVVLPDFISSARVWYAEGTLHFYTVWAGNGPGMVQPSFANPQDPSAGVNWGFVELTNNSGGLFANISYVDFVGLPAGMSLKSSDGSVQAVRGLRNGAVSTICNDLQNQQNRDGQVWGNLCQSGNNGYLRVVAPYDYTRSNSGFENYWTNYVNSVWSHFANTPLTINTQSGAGNIQCTTSGSTLNCQGDNRGYAQPSMGDIFGCNSGPFGIQASDNDVHRAVVPRLCAAFNRATFFVNGGSEQPDGPSVGSYYSTTPTNWYSAFVHQTESDGKGYAFAYDDVTPDGVAPLSGVVSDGNPTDLTITIGGA